MTEREFDQLARRLMLDAARLEYGEMLEERPEHTFSHDFERRMKKMLRRGRHPVLYRTLRAAACLLLALLLSGCTVLAVSPAAREVFVGWVREIHDTYFIYKFFGDEEREPVSKEDILYQPTYVPAGYRIEHRSVSPAGIVTIWYIDDQTGKFVTFDYFPDTSSPVLQITWEDEVIYKKVLVNGKSADLYLDSEEGRANIIVWGDGKNGVAFKLFGVFSEEELIRMAESVKAVPRNVSFRPSWLPEGYYETSAEDCPVKGDEVPKGLDAGKSVLTYENGRGGHLTITYAQEYDVTGLRPDECEADAVSVLVGGDQAFLFLDQTGIRHLVWADGASGVFFWISGPFTGEELVRVAESMEKREGLPPLEARSLIWVPAGYQELERIEMRGQSHVQYQNDEGYIITLSYLRSSEAVHPYVVPSDGGELTLQPVQVGGLPGDLYMEEGEANVLVWSQDGLLFSIQGYCTTEELIAMAESVEVDGPPLEEHWLTWIPYGYQEEGRSLRDNHGHVLYRDEKGHQITLAYRRSSQSASLQISSTLGGTLEAQSVMVNSVPADLYLEESQEAGNALVWEKDGLLFWMIAPCSKEELVKMAESVKTAPVDLRPAWVPEGYAVYERVLRNTNVAITTIYEDQEGKFLIFSCYLNGDFGQIYLTPNEGSVEKHVSVGGHPADLYSATRQGSNSEMIWSNEEAIFYLSGVLPDETMLRVAESVQKQPPLQVTHSPVWLPGDYEYKDGASDLWSIEAKYENGAGEQILFQYGRSNEAESVLKDAWETVEGLKWQDVQVGRCPGRAYIGAGGVNHLIWGPDGAGEIYWLSAPLDGETLMEVAERVNLTAE